MKVAHLRSTSGLYGAERCILALISHVKEINFEIICFDGDDKALVSESSKKGIKTKILKSHGKYSIFDMINELADHISKEQIEVLHTHGYKEDLIGFFAAKKSKIRILSTVHGWCGRDSIKIMVSEIMDRLILSFFDKVCPVSEDIKKTLWSVPSGKIKHINNFLSNSDIPEMRIGNPKLVLYIGRLVKLKRVKDIVLALRYLNGDVTLRIVGDGPERQNLVELSLKYGLGKRVIFEGFKENIYELICDSGIVILPSMTEGIPISVLEAMYLGRAVIGTDIPGIKKLIKQGETGYLVPVKNPRRIASAIKYLIENQEEAQILGKNARDFVEKFFCPRKIAEEYLQLYLDLIQNSGKPQSPA